MLNQQTYKWLGIAAVLAPVLFAAGCDRSRTASNAEKDKVIASFQIPSPDLSKLSDGLREMLRGTRRLVAKDPGATEDVFSLGARYYVHGFPNEAKQCFTYLTQLQPDKAEWWYYLGLDEELLANKSGAIAAFERALKLDESYEPLYLHLADLQAADHPEIAAKRFAEALERNPYSASAQYGLGRLKADAGDVERAEFHLRRATEIAPEYVDAQRALAKILREQGREEEAATHDVADAPEDQKPLVSDPYRVALYQRGYDLRTTLNDAVYLARQGNFDAAHQLLNVAIDIDGAGVLARTMRGNVLVMQKRYEDALADYRAAQDAAPELLGPRKNLAHALLLLDRTDEASEVVESMLKSNPDDVRVLRLSAEIKTRAKKIDEAIALLQRAQSLRPGDGEIARNLAELLAGKGRVPDAIAILNKSLVEAPGDADARWLLGMLLDSSGKKQQARDEWERIVSSKPGFSDAYDALASSYLESGDFQKAERTLKRGLRQAPNSLGLANELAWLLATSPQTEQRKPEEAVRLAEQISKTTENPEPGWLDTLAAAYASNGRFTDAVEAQQRAIELARKQNDADAAAAYQERLKLYQSKKAYLQHVD